MAYCSTCGTKYIVGRERCARCGADLPGRRPETIVTGAGASAGNIRLRRGFAGLVDLGIASALAIVIFRVVILRYTFRTRAVTLGLTFAAALAPGLYLLLRDSLGGKSIGKLLAGLTVVNVKRQRRGGPVDSLLRNLVFGFAVVPVVGWAVTLVMATIAGVAVLSGRPWRIGEGLSDARVIAD